MTVDRPTKKWSPRDMDKMLALLPIMEAKDFKIATWSSPEATELDGKIYPTRPYPEYHPVVHQFEELCYYTSCFIEPYEPLPEDPPEAGEPAFPIHELFPNPEDMARASLNQIRRYLIWCTRGDRFCDGFLDAEFETGRFLAALRQVRRLREAMGS